MHTTTTDMAVCGKHNALMSHNLSLLAALRF